MCEKYWWLYEIISIFEQHVQINRGHRICLGQSQQNPTNPSLTGIKLTMTTNSYLNMAHVYVQELGLSNNPSQDTNYNSKIP